MLYNMSMRPSTQIDCPILPLGESIVRFDLAGIEEALADSKLWRQVHEIIDRSMTSGGGENLPKAQITLKRRLDKAWLQYGLRGAIHIYSWNLAKSVTEDIQMPILRVKDPALVLNVLARTRSQLLLANMPLALEAPFLFKELAADDPRLVSLARQTANKNRR